MAEAFLDVSSGAPRSTPRGSHRTSFIEYVSEVYNNTKSHTSGHMEVLSVRGHSISSGSVASGSSSLARDISIRSENVQSNRVLSGRLRQREATKSARISSGGSKYYFGQMLIILWIQLFKIPADFVFIAKCSEIRAKK